MKDMIERHGDMTRLVQENAVLRAWVRDLLATWADLEGEGVFEAFRRQTLDNLARMKFDVKSSGVDRATAEADETAFTGFVFKVEQELIEEVVKEGRKKWKCGAIRSTD